MIRPINKVKKGVENKPDVLGRKILKVLSKSNRFFAELLDLFPDEAYGRIARAIGWLNQKDKITQDGKGRYKVRGEGGSRMQ